MLKTINEQNQEIKQILSEQLTIFFERLTKVGINPETFSKCLKENNAVIAGSFPLQVILGETWDNSDIDIFVQGNREKYRESGIFKYLDENFEEIIEKKQLPEFKKEQEQEQDKMNTSPKSDYLFDKKIEDIVDFITNRNKSIKIQLIITSVLPKEAISLFDFDFCKITYDGEKFNVNSPWDWQYIIKKTGKMQLQNDLRKNKFYFFEKVFQRFEKYEKRGFKITFTNELQKELTEILDIIIKENEDFEKLYYYDRIFKLAKDNRNGKCF